MPTTEKTADHNNYEAGTGRDTFPAIRFGRLRIGPAILLRLALVATALAYIQTISYSFVFDDVLQIEMNPWIQSWKFWKTFFTGHVWSFGRSLAQGNYYRPTFMLWLASNYSLFKLTPGWWHLTTIALHIIATGLVYLLAGRLLRDHWAAGVAALLFGLSPLHIECVAWISGVPEVLLTIFFVGAFLAYQNWQSTRNRLWVLASLLLYIGALLSKETAMAFVGVLAAYAIAESSDEKLGKRLLRVSLLISMYAVPTIAYLLVRKHVLGGFVNSGYNRPWTWVVMTWPSALWFYLRHLLLPFRLSIFYDLELVRSFHWAAILLPLFGAAIVILALVAIAKRARIALLASTWILLPLVPVLVGICIFPWRDYVHDRYTYLPSVMMAILLALVIRESAKVFTTEAESSLKLQGALAAVIAIVLFISTVVQSRSWNGDLALFAHAHQRAPRNALALDYMARSLYAEGRTQESLERFHELLRSEPDYWPGSYVLGLAYYQLGRYEESETYLDRATKIWQKEFTRPDASQFYYLGLLHQRKGEYERAEVELRRAVEIRPDALGYRYALANVLEKRGQRAEAAEQLRLETENRKAFEQRQKEFDIQ